jgi:hypothetical protein
MFDSFGYNQELIFAHKFNPIPKVHLKLSFHYEKQFIFMYVQMPDKLAFYFHQFHLLPIEFADNFWRPMLGKQSKFGGKVDFFHLVGKRMMKLEFPLKKKAIQYANPSRL